MLLGKRSAHRWDKRLQLDKAWERARLVRRLCIDRQNIERVAQAAMNGERLNKELGVLDVRDKRNRAVNGQATRAVAHGCERRWTAVLVLAGKRDKQRATALCQVRQQRVRCLAALVAAPVLVFGQCLEVDDGDAVLRVKVGRARRAVQRKAKLVQCAHRRQEFLLLAERTNTQQHIVRRHADARREQRTQIRLVLVAAEARHLTGRCHLDAQDGIGATQTRERELRHFDADIVLRQVDLRVRLDRETHHRTRGHFNRIHIRHLRHEGERARCTHVALDDLDFVVLGDELDVARPCDIQRLDNHACRMLDAAHSLDLEVLRRQDERRVTGVHASILHMLRDVVHDEFAVFGDCVHFNLFGTLEILGDNDGVLAIHGRRLRQIAAQILG